MFYSPWWIFIYNHCQCLNAELIQIHLCCYIFTCNGCPGYCADCPGYGVEECITGVTVVRAMV